MINVLRARRDQRMNIRHVHIERKEIVDLAEITAAGWDGRIFRMSRRAYFDLRNTKRGIPGTAAVYVLYADHFDKKDGCNLYVGETKDASRRGNEHEADKDYWTAALLFTSMGDWMNSAHAEAIEAAFIHLAKTAGRYEVQNANDGAQGLNGLGQADAILVERFVVGAEKVLELAGLDVFEPNLSGVFVSRIRHTSLGRDVLCNVRISDPEKGRVEILEGSEVWVLFAEAKVDAAKLAENGDADYDQETSLLTFKRRVEVPCELSLVSPSLFGWNLGKWENVNRQSLKKVLERLRA
jgi:hypothetical protein